MKGRIVWVRGYFACAVLSCCASEGSPVDFRFFLEKFFFFVPLAVPRTDSRVTDFLFSNPIFFFFSIYILLKASLRTETTRGNGEGRTGNGERQSRTGKKNRQI